jgi:hypothetical protein
VAGGCQQEAGDRTGPVCYPLDQRHTPGPSRGASGVIPPGQDVPLRATRSTPAMAPSTLWSCYLCCLLTAATKAASYSPRGYSLYTGGDGALSPGGPQAQSAPRPASRHR